MAASFTAGKSEFDTQMGGERSGFKVVAGRLDLGDSYTTNGEAVTASTFDADASTLVEVVISGISEGGTHLAYFDKDNSKVIAYVIADGTQVSGSADLSGKDFPCIAVLT